MRPAANASLITVRQNLSILATGQGVPEMSCYQRNFRPGHAWGFGALTGGRTPVSFTALGLAKTVPEVPIRDSIQSALIRGEL
jgi:hypothetical protein